MNDNPVKATSSIIIALRRLGLSTLAVDGGGAQLNHRGLLFCVECVPQAI